MRKLVKALTLGIAAILVACGTLLPLHVEMYRGEVNAKVDSICNVYQIENVPISKWSHSVYAQDREDPEEPAEVYESYVFLSKSPLYRRNNFIFVYELPDSTLQFRIE